jgi:hypothetical protein
MSGQVKAAIDKLRDDLSWRGPNGKPLGYVCLPRELAQAVLDQLLRKPKKARSPTPAE